MARIFSSRTTTKCFVYDTLHHLFTAALRPDLDDSCMVIHHTPRQSHSDGFAFGSFPFPTNLKAASDASVNDTLENRASTVYHELLLL